MKFAFIFVAFTLVSWTNSTASVAQNVSDKPFIAQSGDSGEVTIVELEKMALDAINTGERLFVIARLGKAENFNRISVARLAYARTLLLVMRKFPFQTAIFAEGDRVDGEGRIEFYLGSHLRLVTLAKLNKIPNLTCCEDYFPTVKKTKARRKNRKVRIKN